MSREHLRRLEHMYHSAPSNRSHEAQLHVEEGAARVSMQTDPSMHHAAEAVHGHWLFKMLDDAAFFAANSLVPDTFVLTMHFDVHLLAPVQDERLEAHGEVVHEGGSSLLAQARVVDEEENQVARGTGSFVEGRQPLAEIEAYRLPET